MRRFLFDRSGRARYYLTGAGVLYGRDDRPRAVVVERQLLSLGGSHLGWFDGWFLRDPDGLLLAFVKGAPAPAGLTLPAVAAVDFRPAPRPLSLHPVFVSREEPAPCWRWSAAELEDFDRQLG